MAKICDFEEHLCAWRHKVYWTSSITDALNEQHFRAIVAMGNVIVPLIIAELSKQPDLLVAALPLITDADPVSGDDRGDLGAMAQAWIEWYKNERT